MSGETPKILPKITLEEIYGLDFVLNPRASLTNYGWLPDSAARLDLLTGAPLLICGQMPVICSHSVTTEKVRSLFSVAGLEMAPPRHTYRSPSGYRQILDSLHQQKRKLVVYHRHPPEEINYEDYWIDPGIIAFLNDKANLNKLVPPGYVPKRKVIPLNKLERSMKAISLPLVVKAATGRPTGGGYGVFICRNTRDVDDAAGRLQTCKAAVVEEYLEIDKNYNIQFAVTAKGHIVYLGASEQITDLRGHYYGNWIDRQQALPEIVSVLGQSIIKKAARLGYIGIGGFDIVVTTSKRVLVIDLNFRPNGSTPALVLKDSIFEASGDSVLLFHNWKTGMNWNKLLSLFIAAIEGSHMIPLSLHDPGLCPHPDNNYYFTGILKGFSKENVLKKQLHFSKGISL